MEVDGHRSGVSLARSECGEPVSHVAGRMAEMRNSSDRARLHRVGGRPPGDLAEYADLLRALRDLLRRCRLSQRQVVERDSAGVLRRSTVGAVLRGERPARRDVVIAIVRACGLGETAVADWDAAWLRLAQPHLEARHASWLARAVPNLYRLNHGHYWGKR